MEVKKIVIAVLVICIIALVAYVAVPLLSSKGHGQSTTSNSTTPPSNTTSQTNMTCQCLNETQMQMLINDSQPQAQSGIYNLSFVSNAQQNQQYLPPGFNATTNNSWSVSYKTSSSSEAVEQLIVQTTNASGAYNQSVQLAASLYKTSFNTGVVDGLNYSYANVTYPSSGSPTPTIYLLFGYKPGYLMSFSAFTTNPGVASFSSIASAIASSKTPYSTQSSTTNSTNSTTTQTNSTQAYQGCLSNAFTVPIANGYFGTGTFYNWTSTNGFGKKPLNLTYENANGAYYGSPWSGYNGIFFASTYTGGLLLTPGNLTSDPFQVTLPYLNFELISRNTNDTYVELLKNGAPQIKDYFNTVGNGGLNSSKFQTVTISVASLLCSDVSIRVVSDVLGGAGTGYNFIAVGGFYMSRSPEGNPGLLTNQVIVGR